MMTSASVKSSSRYGDPFFHLKRQSVAVLGCIAMLITLHLPMRFWRSISAYLLLLSFVLLTLVYFLALAESSMAVLDGLIWASSIFSLPNWLRYLLLFMWRPIWSGMRMKCAGICWFCETFWWWLAPWSCCISNWIMGRWSSCWQLSFV